MKRYVKVGKDWLKGLVFEVDIKIDHEPKTYSEAYCYNMNLIDPRVHDDEYWCQWVSPYGFVPEAGCPKHD